MSRHVTLDALTFPLDALPHPIAFDGFKQKHDGLKNSMTLRSLLASQSSCVENTIGVKKITRHDILSWELISLRRNYLQTYPAVSGPEQFFGPNLGAPISGVLGGGQE